MPKKKSKEPEADHRYCRDCVHIYACSMHELGDLTNTVADHCGNFEMPKDTVSYFLGFREGEKEERTDKLTFKPIEEINDIFEWMRQMSEAEYHKLQLESELALVNQRIEDLKNMKFDDNGLDIKVDIVIKDPKEKEGEHDRPENTEE